MQTYNQSAFPPFGNTGDGSENIVKNAHDSYDVYVNNQFIGKKVLVTQTEDVDDILSFLEKQGVQNVYGKLDGDHYMIDAHDPEHVKQIMKVYLENR